jgi:hypothetical protein
LEKATEDYLRQTIIAHPLLEGNKSFAANMRAGHYAHALSDIKRARVANREWYYDVIRVLECAGNKQLKLRTI